MLSPPPRLYRQIMHGRKKKEDEKEKLMRKRKSAAVAAAAAVKGSAQPDGDRASKRSK